MGSANNFTVTGMPSVDNAFLDCDNIKNKTHQFVLDRIFMKCIDFCYFTQDNTPDSPQCQSTIDGSSLRSFKEACLYSLWNYIVLVQKEYLECVNQSQQGPR
jgi:hypothetical protein